MWVMNGGDEVDVGRRGLSVRAVTTAFETKVRWEERERRRSNAVSRGGGEGDMEKAEEMEGYVTLSSLVMSEVVEGDGGEGVRKERAW